MPKTLTSFQLFNQVKKRIPGGHKKGASILSFLIKRGYLEQTSQNIYELKSGVKPTKEDVEKLVSGFLKTDS